jgi:hypothetical protein
MTNIEQHANTAAMLNVAIAKLQDALREQRGLEWAGRIQDLIMEAREVRDGVQREVNRAYEK